MNKRNLIPILILSFLIVTSCFASKKEKTNFLIVMVDDMGFSDPGCYGGDVITPNLDKLAENGIRFTNFYNCSRCSPTRASILTGQYAHKAGLWRNGRVLSRNAATIAEVLGANGYQTGMVGKWHLSKSFRLNGKEADHQKWLDHQIETDEPFGALESYPINRGFSKHYGVIWGVVNFFDPFSLVNGKEAVKEVPDDYYITDALTDTTIAYINEFSKNEEPFFIYLTHTAPHWPLHAKAEDIAKYKGKFDEGWQSMRERRFKRQLEMGLFDETTTPLPKNMGAEWESLSKDKKAYMAQKMEAHAAMVDCVDQGLGKIIDALKANDQYENTMIVFLSDNGASPEIPKKPGYDRTGSTRDGQKVMYEPDGIEKVGPELSYTGMGQEWANAVNTPMRFWKKESFNGGNNTPFIVHWPACKKINKGSINRTFGHVMDVMPTFLDIADVKMPNTFENRKLNSLDGKSLLPTLKGKDRKGHEFIYFEHVNGRAVINDEWKMVSICKKSNKKGDFNKWELYNLANDKTETKNVIDKFPERAKRMAEAFDAWWKDNEPYLK